MARPTAADDTLGVAMEGRSWPRLRALIAGNVHRFAFMPQDPALDAVRYTPGLVAVVAATTILAAVLMVATVHFPADPAAVAVGAVVTGVLAFYSVPSVANVPVRWSASLFVLLSMAFAFGAPAVLACSLTESGCFALRRRNGWFRSVFNAAKHMVAGMAAYGVVHSQFAGGGQYHLFVAGVVGGVVYIVIDVALLGVVIRLATRDLSINQWLQMVRGFMLYATTYGLAGGGVAYAYPRVGLFGCFVPALVPVGACQASLVQLARRSFEYNAAQAKAAQREADATEQERERIAGELHDGVVQNLAGLSLDLHNAGRITDQMSPLERHLGEVLLAAADTTRAAAGDLRTLTIEIAPPNLAAAGLPTVLQELLTKAERVGIAPTLELPADLGISERESKLIYRVCLEGVRNAIKYSKASHLLVRVQRTDRTVELTVRDDGGGFTTQQRDERRGEKHMGLDRLAWTAKAGGGELVIRSVPGTGTTLSLVLTVDPAE